MPTFYSIIVNLETEIWDQGGTVAHPLINGVTIVPGLVKVTKVKTDIDVPLTAKFISEDETLMSAGVGTPPAAVDADGNWSWLFTWASLPEMGPRAVLRFEEVKLDGTGAIHNTVVNVTSDDEDPALEPPIGGGGPIGTIIIQP